MLLFLNDPGNQSIKPFRISLHNLEHSLNTLGFIFFGELILKNRSGSLEFSNSDKIAALMSPNTGVADCQEAKHRANGECESTSIRGHGGGSTRP